METLSLVQDPDPLDHLGLSSYQKVMEERENDLLRLQNIELFPCAPSQPPPSLRRESVSSFSSESFSPFSPLSITSPTELSPGSRYSYSIMPSPIRLKPSEVLQVGRLLVRCMFSTVLAQTRTRPSWLVGHLAGLLVN